MKVESVNSFVEFHNLMKDLPTAKHLFRGQQNFAWDLKPKIARGGFEKAVPSNFQEETILDSWLRYSEQLISNKPKDRWDELTLAQHYGLATRLLDWTTNPLVALFFATCDFDNNVDGSVFKMDFSNKTIKTEKYGPFDSKKSGVFYPKGLSARVINQRGIFTLSHKPKKSLEELLPEFKFVKINIKGESKKEIQKQLELYGINEFSIYQDLDNLSNYLNRFVINNTKQSLGIIK